MAWSVPLTAVSNATLTAAQWNASVRDNLLETAPAKATGAGQHFVSTGANAIAARFSSGAGVVTSESSSSTSYVDLATMGPAVTVTTGTQALVVISARMTNSTSGNDVYTSYAISGATTAAASDAWCTSFFAASSSPAQRTAEVRLHDGLTAGSNTFTMKYRVGGGNGTWSVRRISVIPF